MDFKEFRIEKVTNGFVIKHYGNHFIMTKIYKDLKDVIKEIEEFYAE